MQACQQLIQDKGYYTGNIDGIIGPISIQATQKFITDEINKRKWILPKSEFVWVRMDQNLDNRFGDIGIRFNNGTADMVFKCTTVPGDFYIFNPLTVGGITGAAIACEQQVISSHTFITSPNWKSLWLGAPYFMQTRAIEIYRDGNKDRKINKEIRTKGFYGINFHRMGWGSFIDNWSAGCLGPNDNIWFQAIKIFTPNQKTNFTLIEI